VVLAGAAAGYGGDRRRPVTGVPCAAAAAPQGLRPKDAAKAAAPRRRDPRVEPRPTTAGHPGRSFPRLLAPVLAAHGQSRQAWRAEGAPLMTVKKILTATPLRAAVCLCV
jgi:hypothetical protein